MNTLNLTRSRDELNERLKKANPDISPIDTKKIRNDLGLDAEAKRLGKAELPRSDAATMTGVEAKALQVVDKLRQDSYSWGVERLKAFNQEIKSQDVTMLASAVLDMGREFESRSSSLIDSKTQAINSLAGAAKSLEAELREFKKSATLEREANYPGTSGLFLMWSLLALIVVLEGAFNAFFFAKGIETGLIGGFFYAAAFSLLNVAIGFCWGRFGIPEINHASSARKIIGAVSLAGAAVSAVVVGLVIAHFRDALGHDAENASSLAIQRLRESPFGLQEIYSWTLFSLSVIFSALAAGDGYKMDDPYPGYGKLARRMALAKDDLHVELEDSRKELNAIKDDCLSKLEVDAGRAKSQLEFINEAIEGKAVTERKLHVAFTDAQNCLAALLKSFRDTNMLHRKTPPPAYFAEIPELKEIILPPFSTEDDKRRYSEQEWLVSQLSTKLPSVAAEIQDAYNRKRESLAGISYGMDEERTAR